VCSFVHLLENYYTLTAVWLFVHIDKRAWFEIFNFLGAAIGHPIVRDTVYGYNGTAAPHGGLNGTELPTDAASLELQQALHDHAVDTAMCVHAKLIRFNHPVTNEDLEFTSAPSF
jgi:hypothetical protein